MQENFAFWKKMPIFVIQKRNNKKSQLWKNFTESQLSWMMKQ
jgi:hypothetical protein